MADSDRYGYDRNYVAPPKKLREVGIMEICDYCGVSSRDEQAVLIVSYFINAARAFIRGKTGLTDEEIDEHEDFVPVFLTLINEMYTNRDYSVEQAAENKFVKQILAMYSVNYL